MMHVFLKGGVYGKAKEAGGIGLVERGCQESAGIREGEAVRDSDRKTAAAITGRGHPKGDETWCPVQIDPKKAKIEFIEGSRRAPGIQAAVS